MTELLVGSEEWLSEYDERVREQKMNKWVICAVSTKSRPHTDCSSNNKSGEIIEGGFWHMAN